MYEILKELDEKHVTPTREMTLTLARCCRCGVERKILKQNVVRANRAGRTHCPACREEVFHRMTETRFWSIWGGMKGRTVGVSRGAITPRLDAGLTPEAAVADWRASTYPKNRKPRRFTTS